MKLLYIGAADSYRSVRQIFYQSGNALDIVTAPPGDKLPRTLKEFEGGIILYECGVPDSVPLVEVLQASRVPVVALSSIFDEASLPPDCSSRIAGLCFKERPEQLLMTLKGLAEKLQLSQQNHKLEQQLRDEENSYRRLLGDVSDLNFVFDEKGKLFCKNSAKGALDNLGDNIFDYLYEDDRYAFQLLFAQLRENASTPVHAAFRILHNTGLYLWVEGTIAVKQSLQIPRLFLLSCKDFSERRMAEQQLVQVNRLYSVIYEINHMIVAVKDRESLYKDVCHIATKHGGFKMAFIGLFDETDTLRLAECSGVDRSELQPYAEITKEKGPLMAAVAESGRPHVCNNIQRELTISYWREAAAERGFNSFIILPVRRLGKITGMFFLFAEEPDFFCEKEIALLVEAAEDISFKLDILDQEKARKEAELQLKRNELRMRQAQAIAGLGSWEMDFATGSAEWSEEALRIYGLPPDAVKQSYESWMSFVHPVDKVYMTRVLEESGKTLSPSTFQHRIVRRDGSVRYLQSEAHFVLDDQGKPVGMHGTAHDITNIKLAELALRESERRYSTLFYDSPQPKWLYDPETLKFVQVNKAALRKYGFTEEEFYNMTILDIRPKEDCELVLKMVNERSEQSYPQRGRRFRHYTKSGELIDVEIYSSAVTLNDRTYKMVIAIDVTAVNSYEDRMTSAIISAQENERYEIGSELHDNVCQILATSLLKLNILQAKIPDDVAPSYKECKENILLAIKEVRNISHRLAPASLDGHSLIDAVRLLIGTYAAHESTDIRLHFMPSLDECELTQEIKLNLYRILQEQLNNIIKHAGATQVDIKLSLDSEYLEMYIKDNGVGFDPDEVKQGIGIANMRRRVELFRGNLDVDAAPGKGCCVSVAIPTDKILVQREIEQAVA